MNEAQVARDLSAQPALTGSPLNLPTPASAAELPERIVAPKDLLSHLIVDAQRLGPSRMWLVGRSAATTPLWMGRITSIAVPTTVAAHVPRVVAR